MENPGPTLIFSVGANDFIVANVLHRFINEPGKSPSGFLNADIIFLQEIEKVGHIHNQSLYKRFMGYYKDVHEQHSIPGLHISLTQDTPLEKLDIQCVSPENKLIWFVRAHSEDIPELWSNVKLK